MAAPKADFSLYLVTDQRLSGGRPLVDVVAAALRGGVTAVQLREKTASTRAFIEQALALREVIKRSGARMIINDRLDVAQAAGADGVHLGRTDMPLTMARAIVGPSMIIGVSAESVADAMAAEKDGADYAGVSPVFSTATKTDTAPPLGFEGLRNIRRRVRLPLVGIGGLDASNAAEVIRNGGDGVAVVSAIMAADDPEKAARELRGIIDGAKRAGSDGA